MSIDLTVLTNDLQDPQKLLNTLGTFWSDMYGGSELVMDCLAGRELVEDQSFNDVKELAAVASRETVPVYHTDNWYKLIIKQSETSSGIPTIFGDGRVFGIQDDGSQYYFGGNIGTATSVVIDSSIKEISLITDSFLQPTISLNSGVDFYLDVVNNILYFNMELWSGSFVTTPVYDSDGSQTDIQIELWLYDVKVDKGLLYNHYGYILNIWQDTSSIYKDIINNVWDALVGGTSKEQVDSLIASMADVPIVKEDQETIENILSDRSGIVIITDLNVYRFLAGSTPIVVADDVVFKGDQLVDTITIFNLDTDQIPSSLTSITVANNELIEGAYVGDLEWQDTTVSTTVTLNVSGKTKITWPLVGDSTDITTFWNTVHSRGVIAGTTLANMLDNRVDPIDEPTASALPTTINPLQWLIANLLRYNTTVIKVKEDYLSPKATGFSDTSFLRKIVPPQSRIIFQLI